jgi:hypothetical protein
MGDEQGAQGALLEGSTSTGLKFTVLKRKDKAYVYFGTLDDEEKRFQLTAELGSDDPDFTLPFIHQIARLGTKGLFADLQAIKFAISLVRGAQPRDQIGAMLGGHMAAMHFALMDAFDRLNHAEGEEIESAQRCVIRLARAFAGLVEANDRHKNGGGHKLTVRHVSEREHAIPNIQIERAKSSNAPKSTKKTAVAVNGHRSTDEIAKKRHDILNGMDNAS